MRITRMAVLAAAAALAAAIAAPGTAGATGGRAEVHLLTEDGTLTTGSTALPLLGHRVRVRGLDKHDRLVGIDVRPATGALYGVGKSGRLYTVDPRTGKATGIGAPVTLNGRAIGFDFNPTVDRIRLVTSEGQNLRLHPDTGAVAATDGTLAYPSGGEAPKVAAAGYTNSVAGATSTTLYVIDSRNNTLSTQGTRTGVTPVVSPNTGQLFPVGPLGTRLGATNGFDISPSGHALAASGPKLYRVNLDTGRATLAGLAPGNIVGLAFTS
ncbi:hypothetical protein FHS29_007059 [Saccharothrix tamanrassetensis]|uniref:DUF4394 domain-containing protein n=1 Tax=Saccharothrix tamanrassetensis TaxID=1051531 RepID=A0A841CWW1_9PSEU|nr:DUF4394 domain-containing protein [Saccharothrix tamanrassetensis]MBB5960435.1 hypothetical protein [Saccharothrix tamanrassetensis]